MRKVMPGAVLCVLFSLAVGFLPKLVQAAAFDPSAKLIATMDGSGGAGFTVQLSAGVNPPVALTLCTGYNFQTFASGPLPSHPLQMTIGCDQEFFPGRSISVDYNASNSPDFNAFVTLITNGNDDLIFNEADAGLDSNGNITGPGGATGGPESAEISVQHPGQQAGPDLAGFTIDFVRLNITQIQITNTVADGNLTSQEQWTSTWQFWGRKAHP